MPGFVVQGILRPNQGLDWMGCFLKAEKESTSKLVKSVDRFTLLPL
jgi:hypothetical protein